MTPPADNNTGSAAPPGGWSSHRVFIRVGVVLLLVIVAVVAFLLGRGDDASDRDAVAIAYVNAINDGDPRRACELETPRARGHESIDDCTRDREYLRDNHFKANEPEVVRTRELTEGVGVLVKYRVTNNANPQHEALRLIQQDGTWLVDQLEGVTADELASPDPILTVLGETRPDR
jgi:hypothetical protein